MATRAHADARENQKAMEKLHIFENKLFLAEQNREKELQKKLDTIRMHVGFLPSLFPDYKFEFYFRSHVFFSNVIFNEFKLSMSNLYKKWTIFHLQDRHAEEVRQKALNSKMEQNEPIATASG